MVEKLTVELGERSYPITFPDSLHLLKDQLAGDKRAVIIDQSLGRLMAGNLQPDWPLKEEPSGENTKSIAYFDDACEFLASHKVARDWTVIAIGGGVIGDLAGFVAASYLRGISFIQVPTTLLAMVDSSVGGKTGINLKAGKNLVGAFWQPKAVFICTEFLKTLPPQEFSAGMAEVIKYGMLYDPALFEQLEDLEQPLSWDHPDLPGVIRRCCEIKAEIVKADEKETAASGGRALLNLGHTFAHAIENVAGYGSYLHGEAVAIGLHMAAQLSLRLTTEGRTGYAFAESDIARVKNLLATYILPADLQTPLRRGTKTVQPKPLSINALMDAMLRDKKVRSGKLRFVAMEALGRAVTVEDIPEGWVRELWAGVGAR